MNWAVEIQHTSLEAKNLSDLLTGMGFTLTAGVEHRAFSSAELDSSATAAEAFRVGKKLRDAMTGQDVDKDFELGAVLEFSVSPPRRHTFFEPRTGVLNIVGATAELSVAPAPGLTPEQHSDWENERAKQAYAGLLERQRRRLEPALLEPRAVEVLRYLAIERPTGEVLFKLYELMKGSSSESQFHAQFGLAKDFKRFGDCVHNAAVSGDWARHATKHPPKSADPMSQAEAEDYVRRLAERWLRTFRTTSPS